jgi:hypothetical protein
MRWGAALLAVVAAGLGGLIWLDVNGEGWHSWLKPQPVLSAVTLIVGFVVLSWQLRRQHQNALDANRQQSQDRMRLDLYHEIAKRIEAASNPLVVAGMTPTAVAGELTIRLQHPMPSSYSSSQLHEMSIAASNAATDLLRVLETYEIALPEFRVFRRELADADRKLRVALGDFVPLAIPFITFSGSGAPLRWPPTQDEIDEISRLAGVALRAGLDVTAVIHDLRRDAQNYLLGDLFGRQLPKRTPTDQSMKVTSIEG